MFLCVLQLLVYLLFFLLPLRFSIPLLTPEEDLRSKVPMCSCFSFSLCVRWVHFSGAVPLWGECLFFFLLVSVIFNQNGVSSWSQWKIVWVHSFDSFATTTFAKTESKTLQRVGIRAKYMWYLRNKNIHLREQLHSAKALQDRHNKLKKEHRELKQRACSEKQTMQKSLRRVKAKLQKLQAEHCALQDHVQRADC